MYGLIPRRRQQNLFDAFDVFDAFAKSPRFEFSNQNLFSIKTDIKDLGENFVLEAELPGFEKSDINIDTTDGVLTISAKTETSEQKEKDGYLSRERRQGSFKRCFSLEGINQNEITASYKNGVLEVLLPKEKKVEPEVKKIEIA